MYFQRIRFDLTDMVVGTANKAVLERAIAEVADRFGMEWKLFYDGAVKRVAILVSRLDHCLYDILIRHRAGRPPNPVHAGNLGKSTTCKQPDAVC